MSRDYLVRVSRDFVDGVPSFQVTTLQSLGSIGLAKVELECFLFVTWTRYRSVTWLCGWGPLVLSHHPAKFGVHRPYGTLNNGVYYIGSNSNSNAEVPMSRFTNGLKIYLSLIKDLKNKKKKLTLTSFYCLGQETWLDESWRLICTNQSRFYNFFHVEKFKKSLT